MKKKRIKQKKESKINLEDLYRKIAITGSIFLGIFVLFLIAGDYTTSVVYRGYGFGGFRGGEVFDILELYYQYPSVFDLTIFLLIFLGLGQAVLGEHFKEAGTKTTYVGLGIFLALALLLWERQTGYSLLENFGPWAFFIMIVLLAVMVYRFVSTATDSPLMGIGIAYIVFYLFYIGVLESYLGPGSFIGYYFPNSDPLMTLLFFLAIGAFFWGAIKKIKD